VGVRDRHQQRQPTAHVGAPTERDLPHREFVGVHVHQRCGVDAMPRDEFGRLSRERVGLVDVGGRGRLVHELAHPRHEVLVDVARDMVITRQW
jgi:hypothetical protein